MMTREPKNLQMKREQWFVEAATELDESMGTVWQDVKQVSRPKIQPVPDYMRKQVEFDKFYSPKLISIGPLGEFPMGKEYKYMWTAMYLEDTNQTKEDLCKRISDHKPALEELVEDEYVDDGSIPPLLWMIDGCSVLQVLDKCDHHGESPEQELKVSTDQLVRVHEDLLLLENQVPYQLLKILCNDEARLKKCMHNFLQVHGIQVASGNANTGSGESLKEHKVTIQEEVLQDQDEPVHLLDYLRRALLMIGRAKTTEETEIKRKPLHLRQYRIGTIRELKAAGIKVRKDPYDSSVYPSFVDGELRLPELTVDGSTELIFLNLIAYELCPDFRNDLEITSYMVFLSALVDQPEDVKELGSAGILRIELANDKEVADLFNEMDSVLVPETGRYAKIRNDIEEHIKSQPAKMKMLDWMGEAYNTFFRSPWTIIALLAATLGLVLTFIQAWFSIHPKGS